VLLASWAVVVTVDDYVSLFYRTGEKEATMKRRQRRGEGDIGGHVL